MNEITILLQQLVAIDSINPDLVAGRAGEQEIAHFVANWLERAGVEVTLDESVLGRPNVIGITTTRKRRRFNSLYLLRRSPKTRRELGHQASQDVNG